MSSSLNSASPGKKPTTSHYNLVPIVSLGSFSLCVTIVSTVALSAIFSVNPDALNSWAGAGSLILFTASSTTFVGSCVWGIYCHKLQKAAFQKMQAFEQEQRDAAATITLQEIEPIQPLAASERISYPEQQARALEIRIPAFIKSIERILRALCIKHRGSISKEQEESIQVAAKELSSKFLPTQASGSASGSRPATSTIDSAYLKMFYSLSTIPLPSFIMGRRDIENIREAAKDVKGDEAANKRNMCAVVGEYLLGLGEMARICELLGDTVNAANIAQVKALNVEFQVILTGSKDISGEALKAQLMSFIRRLPDPKTLETAWNLTTASASATASTTDAPKDRIKTLADALPEGHQGKACYKHVKEIAKNFAKKLDLSEGCLDSNIAILNRREREIIGKIRLINLCAGPLEFIEDLEKIDKILAIAGQPSKALDIKRLKDQLQVIINKINATPPATEADIRADLTDYIRTLPQAHTFWGNLSDRNLDNIANHYPENSEERLLVSFIKTILKDIVAKKSCILPTTLADTINDIRALNPAFAEVLPYLVLRMTPQEFLRLIADQALPNTNRLLRGTSISEMFTSAMQLPMWIQTLLVVPFAQANQVDAPTRFDITRSVFANITIHDSVDTPVIGGGSRSPLISTVQKVSLVFWWVLKKALNHKFVKSQIALDAPALVKAMLPTLFELISDTDFRRQVLPILTNSAGLQNALRAEAANEPHLDMAKIVGLLTQHCTNLANEITALK